MDTTHIMDITEIDDDDISFDSTSSRIKNNDVNKSSSTRLKYENKV